MPTLKFTMKFVVGKYKKLYRVPDKGDVELEVVVDIEIASPKRLTLFHLPEGNNN